MTARAFPGGGIAVSLVKLESLGRQALSKKKTDRTADSQWQPSRCRV